MCTIPFTDKGRAESCSTHLKIVKQRKSFFFNKLLPNMKQPLSLNGQDCEYQKMPYLFYFNIK